MVETYARDLKESVYHGAIINAMAVVKMSKNESSISGKFDVENGVKSVSIVAISDFTKDYLIKQKNNS